MAKAAPATFDGAFHVVLHNVETTALVDEVSKRTVLRVEVRTLVAHTQIGPDGLANGQVHHCL